jgi:acyl dehydratase
MFDFGIIGKKLGPHAFDYTWKDVVLYALGIGAQTDELPFIYENVNGGLRVFPSFSIRMGTGLLVNVLRNMKVDFSRFIHAEQGIKLNRLLPPEGKTYVEGEITHVYDKGKGALILFRSSTFNTQGEILSEGESKFFYLGEGGFGGDPGPKTEPLGPVEGLKPDYTVSYQIPSNQAALYRLNGDLNPLHLDPDFARRGGFDRPILHGLCTYGYAVRAILHSACGGEVSRFKEFKARFSGVVYPGETLITEGWRDQHGRHLIQSRTDRGVALNQALAIVEE